MEWNSRLVRIGDIFRHFKGKFYRVIGIGHHSETGETMVVYHDVDRSPAECCIRPIEMFMSEVDHEKYPDVLQKNRFELVEHFHATLAEIAHANSEEER